MLAKTGKENQVLRAQLQLQSFVEIDSAKMVKIIGECEQEIDKIINFEIKNSELQKMLNLSREKIDKSYKANVNSNIAFFEKKDKVFHVHQ